MPSIVHGVRHRLGELRGRDVVQAFRDDQGDEPRAYLQRRGRCHDRRAGLAVRSRDDGHAPEHALVRLRRPRAENAAQHLSVYHVGVDAERGCGRGGSEISMTVSLPL